MVHKVILGLALGLLLYLGTQVKADTIYTSTSSNGGTTIIYNLDTGDMDVVISSGEGQQPIIVLPASKRDD